MPSSMSNEDVQAAWAALIQEVRTGVLLTLRNGRPFGSHVPYVFGDDWTRAYLHLSRLALHTQHLLQDVRVSLFVSEPDRPGKNPLALKRFNLQGEAAILKVDAPDYARIAERYLGRFPQSAMTFGFGDFDLWELRMQEAHLVLGFGHAYLAAATAPGQWTHQKPEQKPATPPQVS
ncbi:MAG: HugZ family protein [Nitrospiraceae bacterium]